jgi:hypothetical protein
MSSIGQVRFQQFGVAEPIRESTEDFIRFDNTLVESGKRNTKVDVTVDLVFDKPTESVKKNTQVAFKTSVGDDQITQDDVHNQSYNSATAAAIYA